VTVFASNSDLIDSIAVPYRFYYQYATLVRAIFRLRFQYYPLVYVLLPHAMGTKVGPMLDTYLQVDIPFERSSELSYYITLRVPVHMSSSYTFRSSQAH
jgi:hypothetical protein